MIVVVRKADEVVGEMLGGRGTGLIELVVL